MTTERRRQFAACSNRLAGATFSILATSAPRVPLKATCHCGWQPGRPSERRPSTSKLSDRSTAGIGEAIARRLAAEARKALGQIDVLVNKPVKRCGDWLESPGCSIRRAQGTRPTIDPARRRN